MQGKTHFVVGIATALAICRPDSWSMLIAGTGAAAIGGVISDIDSGSSSAHRDADKVTAVIVGIIAAIVIADVNLKIGIYERLLARASQPRLVTVGAVFVTICATGKSTKHRTFMHSLLAGVILSLCVYLLTPDLVLYFASAFAAHLLLDLLNRRKVQLFWPMKKGFCIGLCHASGWVNRLIFYVGLISAVWLILQSAPMRRMGIAVNDIFLTLRGYLR